MTTLQNKLDEFKADFETNKAPKEAVEIMHRATKDLQESGILDNTIKLGDTLPDFTLKNQDGEEVNLGNLLEKGPVVVSFFRGGWCPYCNIELAALNDAAEQIEAKGATLVVISPQQPKASQKVKRDKNISFDLLSDEGNEFAKELGTVFKLPDDLKGVYQQFGINLPDHNGDESWELPMPLRAVLDTQGVIKYLDINPDYTQRPEIERTFETLDSLNQAEAA